MKTHFCLIAIILFPLSIFSQSNSFGVGIEFSEKSEGSGINFSYDYIFFEKKKIPFLIGIEYSVGISDFYTNDMTGYIGYNEYPEDYTGEISNFFIGRPAVKVGFELSNALFISLSGGYNFFKEAGVFRSDAISTYYVETSNKSNSAYFRLSLELLSSKISPKVGYGSNGLYFGISYQTQSSKLKKHFNDKSKIVQSKHFELGGKNLAKVNFFDLPAMVAVFINDCKENGIFIRKNKIKTEFKQLSKGVLAIANGMNIDGEISIDVDPAKWQEASPSKKWYVLYHELGHDYLNLRHGEGGKLMFNFVDRDYLWEEFFKDKEYMFESYKQLRNNN